MRFFGIYFIIEIVLLVVAGRFLGIGLTLFIILATTILGVLILRLAGLATLMSIRQKVNQGETPDGEMMNGMLLGLGGGLLFLPGLLGNVVGILLVIPASRGLFIQLAKKLLVKYSTKAQQAYGSTNGNQQHKPDIIEGEWERKDK
ncbi:FxsA family protein [Entomomonas sp. E2T0]|uniref:FxsA family protein n=1 Tax=Entomomonas sp. E2T0 TaxID=2930213 RepID=UPI00222810C8|nr:FxsA family protein [Entomomonas sp. E2T0]UYZ84468.1 FxsA family protein [Entomomonas sp. E2T0]